jgi:DNA-binding CsgD family transcriptional regulator/N-acetylneuraminic acid mutarotase
MTEHGEPLSTREKEILSLVATGVTNREVAHRLGISPNTVKVHMRNIFAKLGAESRTEATMIAVQRGLVLFDGGAVSQDERESRAPIEDTAPADATLSAPLPWHKRIALFAALLLAVAGVALTWPAGSPQQEATSDLPLDQPREQPEGSLAKADESSWHERAQMPTRRAYQALTAVEGHIFAIAGQTPEGITGAVEIYAPEEDIWTRGRDKPTPVTYAAGAAIETDIYVPGGCDEAGAPTKTVEVYDTVADAWRESGPLPEPRCAYALTATGGRLYLFGGWDGESYVATTYVYDPRTDTWSQETPMPTKRGFIAAAVLDGDVYVAGGYDNETELAACATYDPETKVWKECAALSVGRGGVGMVSLNGRLYAIGGGGWTSYLGFNERYDAANDSWDAIETPLVEEWRSPGVTAVGGTIYAIGGWSGDYLSQNQAYEPLPFQIFVPVSQN